MRTETLYLTKFSKLLHRVNGVQGNPIFIQ